MDLLFKIKAYLSIDDLDNDDLLSVMIEIAKDYATSYCNLLEYTPNLDNVVLKMVVEDYNRHKSEGIISQSYSGFTETVSSDYSPQTLKLLQKFRRIRFK